MPRGYSFVSVVAPGGQVIPADEIPDNCKAQLFANAIQEAFQAVGTFPCADEFFSTPELRALFVAECDHYSLMALSRASRDARSTVQLEIHNRMRHILQPFIAPSEFESFLDMLHWTGAVVYGSVVRRLLMINSPFELDLDDASRAKYDTSGDLNISTPPGHAADDCIAWFLAQEYVRSNPPSSTTPPSQAAMPARGFQSVMTSFKRYRKVVPGQSAAMYVSIACSRVSVLHVVLASGFSTQSSFFSSTRLYCAYPNLIAKKTCLRTDVVQNHAPR